VKYFHTGSTIKDIRTKPQKIDPLFPCPNNVRTSSTPFPTPFFIVRIHHKFRKIWSFFALKSADVRIWTTPLVRIGQNPSPLTSFMVKLLINLLPAASSGVARDIRTHSLMPLRWIFTWQPCCLCRSERNNMLCSRRRVPSLSYWMLVLIILQVLHFWLLSRLRNFCLPFRYWLPCMLSKNKNYTIRLIFVLTRPEILKTLKVDIHSFPAKRSAFKG